MDGRRTNRDTPVSFRAAEAALPLIPLFLAAWFATRVVPISRGETFTHMWSWVPSLNVNLSFYIDGLSLLFALIISGIGALIFVYAPGYFGNTPGRWRLYAWLLLFMVAMLGLVTANNLITLFIFWELTSITSYMLIGFKHESEKARSAALQALLITGLGGLALLAGLVLLGMAGGSFELTTLLTQGDIVRSHALIAPMIALILLGAFTKSAQFPFHFWLPSAMEAPTPVSAYLHSATMVKAGVYLVARLSPVFAGVSLWEVFVVAAGAVTAVVGGFLAWQQADLKRILAYSTISALGTLMLLFGLGTPLAVKAAIVFLIAHSLYKGALFLVAGTVDHATGTRDVEQLSGLARRIPLVAIAAVLAGISLAGLPPAIGFLAKELVYETGLASEISTAISLTTALLASVFFVVVAGLVAIRPFFGQASSSAESIHRPGWQLTLPPLLLGLAGLAIGLLPNFLATQFVAPAVAAVGHDGSAVYLKLWHGFNLPLLLSGATLASGVAVYMFRHRCVAIVRPLQSLAAWGPAGGYEFMLRGLKQTARWQTLTLQDGRLRVYLLIVLVAFCGLLGVTLTEIDFPTDGAWLDVRFHEVGLALLIVCAAAMVVRSTSRLAAVCALGVIGYAIALLFVMFGAPDLAMTQLAIETLTVILFVFVIYRLPRFTALSRQRTRIRDAAVALTAGGLMSIVVLAATMAHVPSRVSSYFMENSLAEAKGRNVVNVILVDFRALDTLAEITVLSVAALGIFALMRLRVENRLTASRRRRSNRQAGDLGLALVEEPSSRDLSHSGRELCNH